MKYPIILLILDGWGIAPPSSGNAITLAKTPNYDRLLKFYPHTKLYASGEQVGLPQNESGNTETGHLNIGAGHIVYQDLPRINMSIADGSFYSNPAFISAINHIKENKSTLHVMGLIGSGGVHANNEHLFALMRIFREHQLTNVQFHLFTDGRDSSPTESPQHINKIEKELAQGSIGRIATIMGRYYSMDRDLRWERTGKAYYALTKGEGEHASSAIEAVRQSHKKGITDEFIMPTIITDGNEKQGIIKDNDAVIFFNFRIDRPRQLTRAFVLPDFDEFISYENKKGFMSFLSTKKPKFTRGKQIKNLFFVTMTEYEKNLPVHIAFPPEIVRYPIGRVFSTLGLPQLRIAESEKERFVTYYLNGQRETPYIGEDRIIIPSQKVPTYDQAPEMRTREITQTIIEKLNENKYYAIFTNIAAPDMVGHTGNIKAAITACEIVDECIGLLYQKIMDINAYLIITADHGNCEEMLDPITQEKNTEHSTNKVPFIFIGKEYDGKPLLLPEGKLGDIAPTILSFMGLKIPIEMTGKNLLQ